MISSKSVTLLAILASSLTPKCHSLINSTLYLYLVIFISETSIKFVIFFFFLQPQFLQINLSKANLTTAIHYTLASHKLISTNFNAFRIHGTCHYKHFKLSIHHTNTQKLHWLPIKQRIDYKLCLLTYKTLTNQQPSYLYYILSFPSHSIPTRSADSLVFSIPYVQLSLLW